MTSNPRVRLPQLLALARISLANVRRGKWMTATVIASVAIVVVLLIGFLAMAEGFRRTLRNTGSDDIAVVMGREANSESSSRITREQTQILENANAGGQDGGGAALSPELCIIVGGRRRADDTRVNLTLRGLGAQGMALRKGFRLIAGRPFADGRNEIIVGRRLFDDVRGMALWRPIRLGNVDWTVVGVFALDGELFESEIWGPLASVQNGSRRLNEFQSIRLRLREPKALAALTVLSATDPRLDLQVQTERQYYATQAKGSVNLAQYLGWPLALLLAIGAVAGTFNAMLISIQARGREILILRQMGFARGAIFTSLLSESIALSIVGAAIGAVVAYVLFDGVLTATLGKGFTTITYALAVDRRAAVQALALAVAIGACGGLVPAWRAIARTRVTSARGRRAGGAARGEA